jgi:phenylacetate-coenzyme A ligase PaaK-like adenylate-forming protein
VRAGRLRIAPALVLSGSEPLLPEIRRALEETWHVPVHNGYGVSEAGGVATSCDEGDRLHLTDDLLIVEPVDERGRPVPPGTRAAKLYLTNLYNTLQPLIRYEITDEITVLEGTCSCGSGHRTIGDVQGRLSDSFCYPDGVRVHPLRFATPLESERNVVEYQVRQTMRGAAIALVCAGSLDAARLGERIERSLAEAGLAQPEVVVEQVDRLPRQESGKLKRFIAL